MERSDQSFVHSERTTRGSVTPICEAGAGLLVPAAAALIGPAPIEASLAVGAA